MDALFPTFRKTGWLVEAEHHAFLVHHILQGAVCTCPIHVAVAKLDGNEPSHVTGLHDVVEYDSRAPGWDMWHRLAMESLRCC